MIINSIRRKTYFTFIYVRQWALLSLLSVFFTSAVYSQQAGALSFDGVANQVQINNNPSLNFTSAITIEAWVFPTPSANSVIQDVACKSGVPSPNKTTPSNDGYIFPRTDDGWQTFSFYLFIGGAWQVLQSPQFPNLMNAWHHMAATYDGYFMRLFLDGVEVINQPVQTVNRNITTNTNPLTIGVQPNTTEFYSGSVDELRLWNRPLTQCEIQAHKNCELSGPQTGLAAYYKFNQGLVGDLNPLHPTLTDSSGNNNTGVLQNFIATVSNWVAGATSVSGTCSVFSPPVPSVSSSGIKVPGGQEYIAGNDIQLTASGGTSYAWTGPNGFVSTLPNPVITNAQPIASGTYTVQVTASSCTVPANTSLTVVPTGKGLDFDGNNDQVTIVPQNGSLDLTNKFSIETWIYPTNNTTPVQSVISKSGSVQNNSYIFPRTDDGWKNIVFYLKLKGSSQWSIISFPYPGINAWHHVAATYNGTEMKLYLDGVFKASIQAIGVISINTNPLTIGGQPGYSEFFQGKLDETRIWNKVLTECEIQHNMLCELPGPQTGLVASYQYNQGFQTIANPGVTTLIDASGFGNNGTLTGFDLVGVHSNWSSGGISGGSCSVFVPSIVTAANDGPVYEVGSTINLSATGGSAYMWTGPNGFTSNVQNPVITNAAKANSGTYFVSAITGSCSGTANTTLNVAFRAKGLSFDGIKDKVYVPSSPSLNISSAITLEAWIYPTNNIKPVQDVMCKSSMAQNNGYIFPRTDNAWKRIVFYLHLNGAWVTLDAAYPGINQWHHVAATYDGTSMKLYIDDQLAAAKLATGNITLNSDQLTFGQQPGFNEKYGGVVDEARVWNRALSLCEIINDMTGELPLSLGPQNGLAAYYKFNQGFEGLDNSAVTTLFDSSGNNNNGSLDSFTLNGTVSNWVAGNVNGYSKVYHPVVVSVNSTNVSVPVGSTLNLTASGATTYSWTGPNNFTSVSQNPSIVNVLTNASGSYRVVGIGNSLSCTDTAYTNVVVYIVAAITPGGPTSFCPGGNVMLAATSGTGYTYQWSLNGSVIPGATSINYIASQAGNYTVKITDPFNVSATSALLAVTVFALPAVAPITSSTGTSICAGSSLTLSDTTAGGAWSSSNTTVATISSTGIVTGVSAGTTIISYTVTGTGGCATTVSAVVTVVNVLPPIAAISPSGGSICAGSAITLSDTTAGGTWSSSNTAVATVSSGGIVSGLSAGITTISYTVSNSSGCSVTASAFVKVNALPAIPPVSGITTLCAGSTTTLSNAMAGGVWSSSNTAIAGVDASGKVTCVTAGTATINYAVTNSNGCSSMVSAIVTVNALPAVPPISGTTSVCAGSTTTLSNAMTGGVWSSSNTSIAGVDASGKVTGVSAGSATINYAVTNNNGCSSMVSATVTVNALPAIPTISGTTSVCAGSTTILSNAMTGGVWSSSNTAIAGVDVSGKVTGVTAGSATINYTVTNSNGCSSIVSAIVTINALPVISSISGITTLCAGSTTILSNAMTGGVWSSSNTSIAGVDASGKVTGVTAGSATINYTVTNSNGCSSMVSAIVTVNALPVIPPISGTTSVCAGSTTTLSNTTAGGTWSSSNTAVASITSGGVVTGLSAGSTTIKYTITNSSGCTSSVSTVITVNNLPTATISAGGPTAFCSGGSVVLTAASTGTAYLWSTGAVTQSVSVSSTGSYSVKVSNASGCSATSAAISVTANPLPVVPAITGTTTVTIGSSITLNNAAAGGIWSSNSLAATVNAAGVVTGVSVGTATISYTLTNSNGCTAVVSTVVTIAPDQTCLSTLTAIPFDNTYTGGIPTNLYLGYGPQKVTLNVTAIGAGQYTYTWTGGDGSLNAIKTSSAVFTPTVAGYYTFMVLVTNKNGCTSTSRISICVTDIRVKKGGEGDHNKGEGDDDKERERDQIIKSQGDEIKKKNDGDNSDHNKDEHNKDGRDNKDKDGNWKVYLCHVPPGNPGNPQTLSISVNAVPTHLANHPGDRLGSCSQQPCSAPAVVSTSVLTTATQTFTKEQVASADAAGLYVKVSPNPSQTEFVLQVTGSSNLPVSVRVMDEWGRMVDGVTGMPAKTLIHIGSKLISGQYFAQVMQGTKLKTVTLLKIK